MWVGFLESNKLLLYLCCPKPAKPRRMPLCRLRPATAHSCGRSLCRMYDSQPLQSRSNLSTFIKMQVEAHANCQRNQAGTGESYTRGYRGYSTPGVAAATPAMDTDVHGERFPTYSRSHFGQPRMAQRRERQEFAETLAKNHVCERFSPQSNPLVISA